MFGTKDEVCTEATFEGTHTGILHGADGTRIPPTGKPVGSNPLVGVYTFTADKIASFHLYFDQVRVLTELGVLPAPRS